MTDALLEVVGPGGRRLIPAAEFWTGYRETALEPGELLAAVRIPLVPDRQVRFRKIGTRRALAIAKVLVAVAWRPGDAADGPAAWHDVRVALGSVAARPIRAPRTEAVLEGRVPDAAAADEAARTVMDEISPDRRHPLDRRLPAHGHRPRPAPDRPRRGALTGYRPKTRTRAASQGPAPRRRPRGGRGSRWRGSGRCSRASCRRAPSCSRS